MKTKSMMYKQYGGTLYFYKHNLFMYVWGSLIGEHGE